MFTKSARILYMYDRMMKGEAIKKKDMSEKLGVSEKTIQRDISDIRFYFMNCNINDRDIVYDSKGYRIEKI